MRTSLIGFAFLVLCPLVSIAGDEVSVSQVPKSYLGKMSPHLLVRRKSADPQAPLAFLVQMRSQGIGVFNPFGIAQAGRGYRVVLLDSTDAVVHEIVSTTSSPLPDDPRLFANMHEGIVGRCHWTDLNTTDAKERPDDSASLPSQLPPGQYRSVLLVTAGMFRPAFLENYRREPAKWHDPEMEKVVCASESVPLYLDSEGRWWADDRDTSIPTFATLEVEPRVNALHDLALSIWLVNPESRDLVVPIYDLFLPRRDRALRWSVSRDDGFPLGPFRWMQGGSYTHVVALESDIRSVPRNGIVGGFRSRLGTFAKGGEYRVSAVLNESIFSDRRFFRNKEVKPEGGVWKEAFRSPVVTVTIPDLTPTTDPRTDD